MPHSSDGPAVTGAPPAGTPVTCPAARIPGVPIPVSRVFLGTAMEPFMKGQDMSGLLDSVFALGINAFDCARGYGLAERSLGDWIRRRNMRDRVVILSKCGNVDLFRRVRVDRRVIENELDKSLRALDVDTIDIYLLHRDDPKTPLREIMECLNEKQSEGKIRVFGASNWTAERIAEANACAAAHGLNGFTVSSPNYGLAVQTADPWGGRCVTVSGDEDRSSRDWYAGQGMPVVAYSALGRGFFSGRFRSGDYEKAKEVLDSAARKAFLYPVNMERLARCEELAEKHGCTVAEIALRYIFSGPMNVFAVVSSLNEKRMAQNEAAARLPLSPGEVRYLETGSAVPETP